MQQQNCNKKIYHEIFLITFKIILPKSLNILCGWWACVLSILTQKQVKNWEIPFLNYLKIREFFFKFLIALQFH